MLQTRISTTADIPRQRELWQLAFGDDGAYVDNFYHTYYKPERMLMLEEDGVVQAMTAWFDTTFAVPGRGEYRAAYLYAVATHPEARGRGLAGRLLSDADGFFRSWGIPAVTTKPAEPSLHQFFGRNGFRECFVHGQNSFHWEKAERNPGAAKSLEPLSPGEYTALRENWLAETPHNYNPGVRAQYTPMEHWNELPRLAASIDDDHLFVVITARKGTVSYKAALDHLPEELAGNFRGKNLMIIYPDQYGEAANVMTYAAPQMHEERSAYTALREWLGRKMKARGRQDA